MILVVGDKRRLKYRLKKAGAAYPSIGTASISWKLRKPDLTTVTETMTVEDATKAIVYVDPVDGGSASHFTAAGEYQAEVIVTPAGGQAEYPERPSIIIVRAEYEEAEE